MSRLRDRIPRRVELFAWDLTITFAACCLIAWYVLLIGDALRGRL